MLEKEVKILEIDTNEVSKRLLEMGAEKTFEGYIHDIYYDFCEGNSRKMEDNNRLFRIRKKGETHLYTIKRKRKTTKEGSEEGVKIADEGESTITDVDSFEKVLEKYGMQRIREKKKYRTSFKLGNVEFDIDVYDNIPPLLEIEAASKKEIKEYIIGLGLEKNVLKTFGSRGLFEYYGLEYSNF